VTDDRPPDIGWLHYRLAVAACSAFVTGIMLLLVPLILSIGGGSPEPLVLYAFVFSRWGAAILLGTSVLGFIVGDERMANFFAIIWGTHPFWSELEHWLWENETVAAFLGFGVVAMVVGFFWYSFR
jgi:hypothetical protein